MSGGVCPYCRGPVLAEEETVTCTGCGTVHHADCYAENGGCTVFGCTNAPPEEPKVNVTAPDLAHVPVVTGVPIRPAFAVPQPIVASAPGQPEPARVEQIARRVVPSIFGSFEEATATEPEPQEPKSRITFMVLGALLGAVGAHNFYARYYKKAGYQLALTLLTVGFGAPMTWIWAVIDICTIDRDHDGILFRS